jgi:hypothetical protein
MNNTVVAHASDTLFLSKFPVIICLQWKSHRCALFAASAANHNGSLQMILSKLPEEIAPTVRHLARAVPIGT